MITAGLKVGFKTNIAGDEFLLLLKTSLVEF